MFKSEADVEKFGKVFKPMTTYVEEKEQGHTFAYKLLKSEDSPLQLTIYERQAASLQMGIIGQLNI